MSLTILHDGLGRDSRTMAALLAQGRLSIDGKLCGPRDVHAAMFSDTGAEWPHTYDLLARIAAALVALAPAMEPLPPAPPSPGLFDE